MRCLGHGAFREVYQIEETKLAVKFPLESEERGGGNYSARDGKIHTTNEVKKITVLRELVPELSMHLPRIYYHDTASGVLVCSYHEEYDSYSHTGEDEGYHESRMVDDLGSIITKLIRHITGMKCSDLHYGNVHKKRTKGQNCEYTDAVLIDLGY
jgi:hypothetical protein